MYRRHKRYVTKAGEVVWVRATVTLLGQDGTGVSGRNVRIDGKPATACGSGWWRASSASSPPAGGMAAGLPVAASRIGTSARIWPSSARRRRVRHFDSPPCPWSRPWRPAASLVVR